jgi:hypothetical protein
MFSVRRYISLLPSNLGHKMTAVSAASRSDGPQALQLQPSETCCDAFRRRGVEVDDSVSFSVILTLSYETRLNNSENFRHDCRRHPRWNGATAHGRSSGAWRNFKSHCVYLRAAMLPDHILPCRLRILSGPLQLNRKSV